MSLFAADTMRNGVTAALDQALAESRFFDTTAAAGFAGGAFNPPAGNGRFYWRHDRARLEIRWTTAEVNVTVSVRPSHLTEVEPIREDTGRSFDVGPHWSRNIDTDQRNIHAALVSALEIVAAATIHRHRYAIHPAVFAAGVCPRCKTERSMERHTRSTAIESIDEDGAITIRTVTDPTLVVCSACDNTWLAPHRNDPDIHRPLADLR